MYGRSYGDGGDTSSSSDGRFYDDPHSDAWAAQAPAFGHWSPRSARRRREHYASRGDGYSDYYSYEHDAPPSSSQSGYSEYYSASSEPYDEPAFYEAGYHDRSAYRHDYQQQRSYSTYLAGPAFSPRYRRTPTPSPPPAPLPSSPSPDYIQVASLPSSPSPSAPRKLVILDLNGTLLVRTARGVPHPRPYMPVLRDFLFAPRTRAWLDAMVWSSAQPHNVDRMVRRCFFDAVLGAPAAGTAACDANEGFVAVWARDTLGLSHGDYSKKTQTTKDLAKPWAALASSAPSTSSANAPTSASSADPPREPHSAYTTFLLDDSPAKARLQPYSHVCIREYAEQARERDVRLKVRALFAQVEIKPEPAQVEEVDGEVEPEVPSSESVDAHELENENEKEVNVSEKTQRRKRKRRKAERAAASQSAIPTLTSGSSVLPAADGEKGASADAAPAPPMQEALARVEEAHGEVEPEVPSSESLDAHELENEKEEEVLVSERTTRRKERKMRRKAERAAASQSAIPTFISASSVPPAADGEEGVSADASPASSAPAPAPSRKDRKKKMKSLAELHDADAIKEKEVGKTGDGEGAAALDETLLAVIGILAALRRESNVAGWIRAGGLWAGRAPPAPSSASAHPRTFDARAPSPTDAELAEPAGAEPGGSLTASGAEDMRMKRQRSVGSDGSEDAEGRVDGDGAGAAKKRARVDLAPPSADAAAVLPSATRETEEEGEAVIPAGNDAATLGGDVSRALGASADVDAEKMWFEDAPTFVHWVACGRAALRELGIEERDGLVVS